MGGHIGYITYIIYEVQNEVNLTLPDIIVGYWLNFSSWQLRVAITLNAGVVLGNPNIWVYGTIHLLCNPVWRLLGF